MTGRAADPAGDSAADAARDPGAESAAEPARPDRSSLTRFAWLSIAAAVATISLKTFAWLLTGSVGLLSDAAESVVNLVAAVVALIALAVAAKPADHNHLFGHAKAEYFSAALEGAMIFVAAVVIMVAAVERLLHPRELDDIGAGLAVSMLASVINGVVGVVLLRAARRHRSMTLKADGRHLLTDVWTSAGVLIGVLAVGLTGWDRLDPLIAIAVGINIVFTGGKLVSESVAGLMDHAMSSHDHDRIVAILNRFLDEQVGVHALRTRESGVEQFIDFHVLVPGAWTVSQGHDLLEEIEAGLRKDFPTAQITTHLEPREDPRAYNDYTAEVPLDDPPEAVRRGTLGEPGSAVETDPIEET